MRFLALLFLACNFANATPLDENTLFGGDVIGTYDNLRLRVPVSTQSATSGTSTFITYSGTTLTDIDAGAITTGTLDPARLDASSVTLQGNIFNVSDRLLKILTSGYIWNDLIDATTWISTNTALGADLSGFLPLAQVVDDSHNHSQISVTGFTTSTGTTLEIAQATTTANATLLASSPTLSGTWAFLNAINGSITGNAGTVTNGLYTSSPLNWENLYNYPAQCGAGYAIQSASNTITCVALPTFSQNFDLAQATGTLVWSSLSNFPASCAPQCVVAVGTTLTCGPCSGGGSGGGNAYTDVGVVGQIPYYVAVDSIAATGIPIDTVLTSTMPIVYSDRDNEIIASLTDGLDFSLTNSAEGMASFFMSAGSYSGFGIQTLPGNDIDYSSSTLIYQNGGELRIGTRYAKRLSFFTNDFANTRLSIEGNGAITATSSFTVANAMSANSYNGITPSAILTSTSTRVAFRDIDNNFSQTQTMQYGIVTTTATTTSTASLAAVSITGEAAFTSAESTATFAGWIDVGMVQISSTCALGSTDCTATCPTGKIATSCTFATASGSASISYRLWFVSNHTACQYVPNLPTATTIVYADCMRIKY